MGYFDIGHNAQCLLNVVIRYYCVCRLNMTHKRPYLLNSVSFSGCAFVRERIYLIKLYITEFLTQNVACLRKQQQAQRGLFLAVNATWKMIKYRLSFSAI